MMCGVDGATYWWWWKHFSGVNSLMLFCCGGVQVFLTLVLVVVRGGSVGVVVRNMMQRWLVFMGRCQKVVMASKYIL